MTATAAIMITAATAIMTIATVLFSPSFLSPDVTSGAAEELSEGLEVSSADTAGSVSSAPAFGVKISLVSATLPSEATNFTV